MRTLRGWGPAVFLSGLVVIVVIASVWLVHAQTSDDHSLQAKVLSIAADLHAPGDENTITVATSTLDTAQHMRYEIQQDLLSGMSRQSILEAMQKEYGSDVLAAPKVSGFGSLVWIVPWGFLLAIGIFAVWYARRKARQRDQEPVSNKTNPDLAEPPSNFDVDLHSYL